MTARLGYLQWHAMAAALHLAGVEQVELPAGSYDERTSGPWRFPHEIDPDGCGYVYMDERVLWILDADEARAHAATLLPLTGPDDAPPDAPSNMRRFLAGDTKPTDACVALVLGRKDAPDGWALCTHMRKKDGGGLTGWLDVFVRPELRRTGRGTTLAIGGLATLEGMGVLDVGLSRTPLAEYLAHQFLRLNPGEMVQAALFMPAARLPVVKEMLWLPSDLTGSGENNGDPEQDGATS